MSAIGSSSRTTCTAKGGFGTFAPPRRNRPSGPTAARDAIRSADRPLREQAARQLAADPKGRSAAVGKAGPSRSIRPRVRAVAIMALANVKRLRADSKHRGRGQVTGSTSARDSQFAGRKRALRRTWGQLACGEVLAETLRQCLRSGSKRPYCGRYVSDPDAFVAQAARLALARSHVVETPRST